MYRAEGLRFFSTSDVSTPIYTFPQTVLKLRNYLITFDHLNLDPPIPRFELLM